MTRARILFVFLIFTMTTMLTAQNVGINDNGAQPDASAMLDIQSNDKGILIPRMSTIARNMINNPAQGLLVYDTTTDGFWFFDGNEWIELITEVEGDGDWEISGNDMFSNVSGNVGIGTNMPNAPLDVATPFGQPSIVTRGGFDYATETGQYMHFGHWDGSTFSERMVVNPNGNLGLGTSNPTFPIHVLADGEKGLKLQQGNGNYQQIRWTDTNDALQAAISVDHNSPQMNFFVNGADRIHIKETGNVGIGTSNTFAQLTLTESLGFTNGTSPMLYIFEDGTSNPTRPIIAHSLDFPDFGLAYQDDGDKMIFQGNGNPKMAIRLGGGGGVGIGTDDPDTELHVLGSENNGSDATLKITSDDQNMLLDGNEIDTDSEGLFLNHNSAANVILATGGGRVGIGINPPNAALEVAADGAEPSIVTRDGTDYAVRTGQTINMGHWDGTTFIERWRIDNDGEMAIGTTETTHRLHVFGDEFTGDDLFKISSFNNEVEATAMEVVDENNNLYFRIKSTGAGNNDTGEIFIGGELGIGTANVMARLDVVALGSEPSILTRGGSDYAVQTGQEINIGHWDGTTFTERLRFSPQGHLFVPGITYDDKHNMQYDPNTGRFYYDNSSRRYKENITPLEDDFELILKAQPKTYTRPDDPNSWEVGYIAEEMDSLGLTKLVSFDTEGIPDGFNYEKMILYVNEILKVHHSEFAQLKEENAYLTENMNAMNVELSDMKYLMIGFMILAVLLLFLSKIKSTSFSSLSKPVLINPTNNSL